MADWQRHVQMGDVWDTEDIPLLAKTAADRLEALEPFTLNPGIEKIKKSLVERLRKLAKNPKATAYLFDHLWSDVYDWGDISLDGKWNGRKVCFIDIWTRP